MNKTDSDFNMSNFDVDYDGVSIPVPNFSNPFDYITLIESIVHLAVTAAVCIRLQFPGFIINRFVVRYLTLLLIFSIINTLFLIVAVYSGGGALTDYIGLWVANFEILFIVLGEIQVLKTFAVLSAYLTRERLLYAQYLVCLIFIISQIGMIIKAGSIGVPSSSFLSNLLNLGYLTSGGSFIFAVLNDSWLVWAITSHAKEKKRKLLLNTPSKEGTPIPSTISINGSKQLVILVICSLTYDCVTTSLALAANDNTLLSLRVLVVDLCSWHPLFNVAIFYLIQRVKVKNKPNPNPKPIELLTPLTQSLQQDKATLIVNNKD